MREKTEYLWGSTDHSEQSSVLKTWVELHQSRLCTTLPLNKTTKQKKPKKYSVCAEKISSTTERGNATTRRSTNHGKSSKIGLVLVLNTAMIAGRSAACGSPERTEGTEISY